MQALCVAPEAPCEIQDRLGVYLTFTLDGEVFAVPIPQVQEIIGMLSVIRLPQMSGSVRGVVRLRDSVFPVLDLRVGFGMPRQEDTELTSIVVVHRQVQNRSETIGMIVDEVSEVVVIAADEIQDLPEFGATDSPELLFGMARVHDRVVLLLDLEKALARSESVSERKSVTV